MVDRAAAPLEAPPYVVVCFIEDPEASDGHDHVAAVETRDPDGGTTLWSPVDVISAIRQGDRFVLEGGDGGSQPRLEPGVCPACALVTLTVDPPASRPAAC